MINIFGFEFQKDQIELILFITGTIFSIIGGFIGFFLRRWHIKYQLKIKNFMDASNEFSRAFDESLIRLHNIIPYSVSGILKKEMPRQKMAYDKFRPMLLKIKGRKTITMFDRTWNEYYNTEKHGNHPFAEYSIKTLGTKETQKIAIVRINHLLGFVNH